MKHKLINITRAGIGALVFTLVLGLALVQPAKADFKVHQVNFVEDCNGDPITDFGDGYVSTGVPDTGNVIVPPGNQLEVFNFGVGQGVIKVDCTVTLAGEDSELNLAEGTNLLFFCDGACVADGGIAGFKDFTITAAGAGFEIEVQVKKNSFIEAKISHYSSTALRRPRLSSRRISA